MSLIEPQFSKAKLPIFESIAQDSLEQLHKRVRRQWMTYRASFYSPFRLQTDPSRSLLLGCRRVDYVWYRGYYRPRYHYWPLHVAELVLPHQKSKPPTTIQVIRLQFAPRVFSPFGQSSSSRTTPRPGPAPQYRHQWQLHGHLPCTNRYWLPHLIWVGLHQQSHLAQVLLFLHR